MGSVLKKVIQYRFISMRYCITEILQNHTKSYGISVENIPYKWKIALHYSLYGYR